MAASLLATALTILAGLLSYLVVVQWLQHRPLLSVLGTIGLAAAIRGAAALAWGRDVHSVPNFSPVPYVVLGGLSIPTQALWMLGALLALAALLGGFLRGTLEGRAFAACSINPAGAALCGIPQLPIGLLAFGLAGAAGAVAGIVLAPVTFTSYDAGLGLGLRGFCSAAAGGMRSLPLTVLGGVGLGLLESFSMRYVTSSYKDVIIFALLIAVLIANSARLNRTLGESVA
jgi:branched-chain amino acid transport system permease protein